MKRIKRFRHSTTYYRRKNKLKAKDIVVASTSESSNSKHVLFDSIDNDERTSFCSNTLDSDISEIISCPSSDETEDLNEDKSQLDLKDFLTHSDSDINQAGQIQSDSVGKKIKMFLPAWAINNKIPHSALNELLQGLTSCGISSLPKDSRTLLKTSTQKAKIKPMHSGEFWYNGIEKCLKSMSKCVDLTKEQPVKLNFHIDGIPINKSSRHQFWPILLNISNLLHVKPEVVAIFYGESKPPSAKEFLEEFTKELNFLLKNGCTIGENKLSIAINAIIGDTPARSFIKCTVQFNAYSSCLKCTVRGEYHRQQRHMSFPQTNCPLRTDESFRGKTDTDHHLKNSDGNCVSTPLEDLPIDLIKDIPIADSLHLLDLGIMKKCLGGWVNGSKNFKVKFFIPQIDAISKWLVECNNRMPVEIHRSVRSLSCLSFWKATEYRTFLLYCSIVILRDHLSTELYRHFLLFFCAVWLTSSDYYKSKLPLAKELFCDYIEGFVTNYGVDSISSNVHNLCHIVDDVERFGPLPNISSYPFENKLGLIKGYLRSGKKPLSQICKRFSEIESLEPKKNSNEQYPILKYEITDESKKHPDTNKSFKKVILKNNICFSTNNNNKDQWLMTINKEIFKIISIGILNNEIVFWCTKLKSKLRNFFEYPFDSAHLDIYISQEIFCRKESIRLSDIKCKLVTCMYNNEIVFLPLLHTIDLFQHSLVQ